jgi:hypothetical protein
MDNNLPVDKQKIDDVPIDDDEELEPEEEYDEETIW